MRGEPAREKVQVKITLRMEKNKRKDQERWLVLSAVAPERAFERAMVDISRHPSPPEKIKVPIIPIANFNTSNLLNNQGKLKK